MEPGPEGRTEPGPEGQMEAGPWVQRGAIQEIRCQPAIVSLALLSQGLPLSLEARLT